MELLINLSKIFMESTNLICNSKNDEDLTEEMDTQKGKLLKHDEEPQ